MAKGLILLRGVLSENQVFSGFKYRNGQKQPEIDK